jgi:uncharacterized protein (TIGR03066 family)
MLPTPARADRPAELLIGKWTGKQKSKDVEVETTYDFARGGTLTAEVKVPGQAEPITVRGAYRILDAATMEITITINDRTMTDRGAFKVTDDTLTLIGARGATTSLKRVGL